MSLRGRNNLTENRFFFITTTVKGFNKIFVREICCDLLIKNIKHYQAKYKFTIYGYVIMPSHFHWIVEVEPKLGTISDIMRDIKKYSAWNIMEIIEKKDVTDFNVNTTTARGQRRQFWMHRFDDEAIRNAKMFWIKLRYIHNNPIEAGLALRAEDYKYSSARNYILGDHSVIYVDTSMEPVSI